MNGANEVAMDAVVAAGGMVGTGSCAGCIVLNFKAFRIVAGEIVVRAGYSSFVVSPSAVMSWLGGGDLRN